MKRAMISMLLVMIAMIQLTVKPGHAAITCSQVDSSLASCMPYLTAGGTPAADCCNGVKSLKSNTPTTADRRAACNCVKAAAARYPVIKEDAASSLPAKCGVEMSIPISMNTNCNNIE